MSAIYYNYYGDHTVLKKSSDIPVPQLNTLNNTLVQVTFASFNPIDYKIRSGYLKLFYRALFPQVTGQDFSGIVVKPPSSKCDDTKNNVTTSTKNNNGSNAKFKVGDRVFGMLENQGACGEYVAAPEQTLALVPEEMSLAEAACLPTAALATYETMIKIGGFSPVTVPKSTKSSSSTTTTTSDDTTVAAEGGDATTITKTSTTKKPKVLILGSSGGVGSFAVQYAKKVLGAEVHATCSAVNVDYVKSLGADFVYDYSSDAHFEKLIPKNMDLVMDNVGSDEMYRKTFKLLHRGGKYVLISVGNDPMTYMKGSATGAKLVWKKVTSFLRLSPSYHVVATRANGASLAQVVQQYTAAQMSPGYITRAYAFTESNAQVAHRLLETRRTRGKILMQIPENLPPREALLSQLFLNKYGHNIVGWRNTAKLNSPPGPSFENVWITGNSRK